MILYGGHSLCRGERIYEGVRVNYTPGVLWVTAAIFRLSGESVLGPRLAMVGVFTALVLTCRGILVKVGAPLMADVTALALVGLRAFLHPHFTMISYTSFAVLLFLLGLRATLASPPRLAIAGLCAGAAIAFKQNVGGLAVIAIAMAVLLLLPPPRWPRALLRAAAGTALPVAVMLALIGLTGDFARFWKDAVRDNATFGAFWNVPYPLFLGAAAIEKDAFFYVPARIFGFLYARPSLFAGVQPLFPWLVRLIYLAPVLSIGLLLLRVRRDQRTAQGRAMLVLAVASALLLFMAWPLATILHWATASLGALLCVGAACAGRRRAEIACGALLLAAGTAGLVFEISVLAREQSPLDVGAGTLFTNAGTALHMSSMLGFLKDHVPPGEPIFVVPYAPLYYLASHHENALRDDYVIPPWSDEARTAVIADELASKRVRFVVWSHAELPRFGRFEDFARPLATAIRKRYRIVARSGGGSPRDEVWQLAADPAQTSQPWEGGVAP